MPTVSRRLAPTGERHNTVPVSYPLALGLTLAVTGIVLSWIICGIGVVITLVALRLWIRDTRRDISELPLEH